eukprot:scaffold1498_cov129-Isochrysis_galbana.AAC.4
MPHPAPCQSFCVLNNWETTGAGGLGEFLGALARGAATCDDAALSGAHAVALQIMREFSRPITAAT